MRTVAVKDAGVTTRRETMRPEHMRGTGACVSVRATERILAGAEGAELKRIYEGEKTVAERTYTNTEMTENLHEILTK